MRKQKPVRSANDTDVSFAKKQDAFEKRLAEGANIIQYWIYDAPQIGVLKEDVEFSTRFLDCANTLLPNADCIVRVPTSWVYDEEELNEAYESYITEGYEGQIVRTDSPYENKRSKGLLKRKEFQDAEYRVVGIDEGNGTRTGTAKHLVLWCDDQEKEFNSNIKGSFDFLKEVLDNKEDYIGKQATIRFFQLTPDGIPRFPFAVGFRDYE